MNILIEEKSKKLSDAELVERSKVNPNYFAYLLYRYEKQLFYYLKKISNLHTETIEDLLQEIFIKVYQNLNDYDPDLKFSSWIYRIAHNHLIDYIRKEKQHLKFSIDKEDSFLQLKSEFNLKHNVENKECNKIIEENINLLDDKYKEVLILRFLEQKSYEEIMDILQKPKGSIATLIKRGKEQLYKLLKDKHEDCL